MLDVFGVLEVGSVRGEAVPSGQSIHTSPAIQILQEERERFCTTVSKISGGNPSIWEISWSQLAKDIAHFWGKKAFKCIFIAQMRIFSHFHFRAVTCSFTWKAKTRFWFFSITNSLEPKALSLPHSVFCLRYTPVPNPRFYQLGSSCLGHSSCNHHDRQPGKEKKS